MTVLFSTVPEALRKVCTWGLDVSKFPKNSWCNCQAIALKLKTIGKSKSLEVLVPIPGMLQRFQKIRDGKSGTA